MAEITYIDELLADRSVHRRYSDGRQEWRRRDADGLVHWRDDQGRTGSDEQLGNRIVKRMFEDGTVRYGRDLGFGRTVWSRTGNVTVNRSSFRGRLGLVLGAAGLGLGAVALASQLPPEHLSAEEEEELRQQAQRSGGDGGGGGDSGAYAGWDSGADDDYDDFG